MDKPFKNKVFVISGVPRSGKTQLARLLLKQYSIPYIGTDTVRFLLEKRFTEEIEKFPKDKRHKMMWPHLKSLILTELEFTQTGFCIEGDALRPEFMKELIGTDNLKIIYIGYAYTTPQEKLKLIREYNDETDWTDKMSDEEVADMLKGLVERSKEWQKKCEELGFKYFDTSNPDTFDEVIEEAMKYLISVA